MAEKDREKERLLKEIEALRGEVEALKDADIRHRRTEEELERSRDLFSHLVSASPAVLYTARADGDYGATFISENIRGQLGYEPADFIGDTGFWLKCIHPDDLSHVMAGLPRLFERGRHSHEYRFRHKDGTYRWMYDELKLDRGADGRPAEIIGYWIDVTERKEAEESLKRYNAAMQDKTIELEFAKLQAEASNMAKSEFISNMSHELRTPLSAIIAAAELIHDGHVNGSEQKEIVDSILLSSRHLLRMINDVLTLSDMEAGDARLKLTEFNVLEMLEESAALLSQRAMRKKLSFSVDVGDDVEKILADRDKIKKVVLNLLSNAVKFSPDGRTVVMKAKTGDGMNRSFVEISVADEGAGISEKDRDRLFKPFEILSGVYTKKLEGAGLGLYSAKKIIEMHGGNIWLEECGEKKGSTFTFSIPVAGTN